jgi:hypothetical protein
MVSSPRNGSASTTEAETSKYPFSSQRSIGEWLLILILLGMLVANCRAFTSESFSMKITGEKINDPAA